MEFIKFCDEPLINCKEDQLGLIKYVEALSQVICECETPFNISIQGDWGSGKTSFMNLLKEKLSLNCKVIFFNTWHFSQFELKNDLPIILISKILKDIGIKEKYIKSIFPLIDAASSVSKKIISSYFRNDFLDNPINILSKWIKEKFSKDPYGQFLDIKSKLQKGVINQLKDNEKINRIVIFIDDIDRMNADKAIELLEIIKSFLDVKGCIFVLALDYDRLRNVLEKKYINDIDKKNYVDFFDKFIQLNFNMPISKYDIKNYIIKLLNLVESYGNEINGTILDDKKEKIKLDQEIYYNLAINSIGNNPRALKKIAFKYNLYFIIMDKYKIIEKYIDTSRNVFMRSLFAILCLQETYKPIYELIIQNETIDNNLFKKLYSLACYKEKEYVELAENYVAAWNKCQSKNNFHDFIDYWRLALQVFDNSEFPLKEKELTILNELFLLCSFDYKYEDNRYMNNNIITITISKKIKDIASKIKEKFLVKNKLDIDFPGDIKSLSDSSELGIYFNFDIGTISFTSFIRYTKFGIDISIEDLDDNLKGYKPFIAKWIEENCNGLPRMHYNQWKKRFIYFETIKWYNMNSDEDKILRFEIDTEFYLKKILIPLWVLYKKNFETIKALDEIAKNTLIFLSENFLSPEWIINNENFDSLRRWSRIKISRPAWNDKFFICLEYSENFIQNIYCGIRKSQWRGTFKNNKDIEIKHIAINKHKKVMKTSEYFICYSSIKEREYINLTKKTYFEEGFYLNCKDKDIKDFIKKSVIAITKDIIKYKEMVNSLDELIEYKEY